MDINIVSQKPIHSIQVLAGLLYTLKNQHKLKKKIKSNCMTQDCLELKADQSLPPQLWNMNVCHDAWISQTSV